MNKENSPIFMLCNICQYIFASVQTNELFQIIELVASITLSIVLIAYRVYRWSKEAGEDGEISKDEIEELGETISEGLEDIKEKFKGEQDDKK